MYLKKTWIYRDHIEIKKYHTSRYGIKGEKRLRKIRPTEESVRLANERNAKAKLKRLLINNFDFGDWHLTLTYKDAPDPEEAKVRTKKFFTKMRKEYTALGKELKYVVVTEYKAKRIHHHVVINDIPDFSKKVAKIWTCGGQHMTPLYPDYDYEGLAEYLVKETCKTFRDKDNPFRQRYSCSRNLKKPEERTEIIEANKWNTNPKVPKSIADKGYYIDKESVYEGVDTFGYPFMTYTMIRRVRIT